MALTSFQKKKDAEKLVCLTAYTYYMAALVAPSVDLILVGDSLGMVQYGMKSTLSVTLDMMIMHGKAVVDGASSQVPVIVDMPFGTYQESPEQAFRNAALIMQQTGCDGVKLEGGQEMADTIGFLVQRGVPVMGHIGLKPQSVHVHGGYRMTGKHDTEKKQIKADSDAISRSGCFAMVLECVDSDLAAQITNDVVCPTIGIGASVKCDGQILVTEDILGMTGHKVPSFVKQYADLSDTIRDSIENYTQDVKKGNLSD